MLPLASKKYGPIELKLGIKSSLPHVKSAIALIIALWKADGQQSICAYSQEVSNKINISNKSFGDLIQYFDKLVVDEQKFKQAVNSNPLLSSQIESLKVSFELIWKIGIFEFEDKDKAFSTEREGQVRFAKKILFTKDMDIINLVLKQNEDACKDVLFSWITGKATTAAYANNEADLIICLTILSEEAVYRLRYDENNSLKFRNLGIYERFTTGSEQVDAQDFKENMGPLRILHSIISENLSPYLKKIGNLIGLKDPSSSLEIKEYARRIDNYLSLTPTSINVTFEESGSSTDSETAAESIGYPYNRILFGAPGTGKSYIIEQNRVVFGDNYERVTFHPNYSYAQFVGTYKPRPKTKDGGIEYVSYEYVVGPFLRLWTKAKQNPDTNYLLIVEEINRANPAGVFGDIFQLLDRKADGISEYPITTSEDMRDYLVNTNKFEASEVAEIKIPSNLYIWATMNSADQGVFPMDSAFKRRWTFEYISINEGMEDIEGKMITLTPYGEIEWNRLRTLINDQLTSADLNINEDKLIGPFFISVEELDSDNINDIFKSKLLMYLFEDVLKHRRGKLFAPQYNTFSKIVAAYDNGQNPFSFDIGAAPSSTD